MKNYNMKKVNWWIIKELEYAMKTCGLTYDQISEKMGYPYNKRVMPKIIRGCEVDVYDVMKVYETIKDIVDSEGYSPKQRDYVEWLGNYLNRYINDELGC